MEQKTMGSSIKGSNKNRLTLTLDGNAEFAILSMKMPMLSVSNVISDFTIIFMLTCTCL